MFLVGIWETRGVRNSKEKVIRRKCRVSEPKGILFPPIPLHGGGVKVSHFLSLFSLFFIQGQEKITFSPVPLSCFWINFRVADPSGKPKNCDIGGIFALLDE